MQKGLSHSQHWHIHQEERPQWIRTHGWCLGEEQSLESVLCPAISSCEAGKAPVDSSNFDTELELPSVQEFTMLPCEPL